MTLAAALSDLELEFIDGVVGSSISDKALPKTSDYDRPGDPVLGARRGHINAIQEVVRRNISSALIMEDDADWDVRIRGQLQNFALSSHALIQPLARTGHITYADVTYPTPSDTSPSSVPDMEFSSLPLTLGPLSSPYGDEWDVLWLGHCAMHFPSVEGKLLPKGRVVQFDETVPERKYLWSIALVDDLREQYPDHTRVTHHAEAGCCSLAYAVTQKSARKMLYELALKDVNTAFDLMVAQFCDGNGEPNRGRHNCLTTMPSLFNIHLPAGARNHESDISDHGPGYSQEPVTEIVRTSVKMNALALMEGRTDLVDAHPDSLPAVSNCEGDCTT
ncbi:hypothetical protein F5Y16DRAFT_389509 [Xylariaceae sp. FL0255]|nr:hypothetical protein F5Y16DRAFT_389509 [Xylariaceae sp. FL0255]